MDSSMMRFLEELRAIPNEEKLAYLKAASTCCELIHQESPVRRFFPADMDQSPINSTGQNVSMDKAARKFVEYWNSRMEAFGKDNAFRPLCLLHGALTTGCVAVLRSAWAWPLPRDERGRPVCFFNFTVESAKPGNPELYEDRLRCLFYVLQVFSEDEASRTHGCVLLILYDKSFFEANGILLRLDNMIRSLPLRLSEIHVIPQGVTPDDSNFYQSFVRFSLKLLLSSNHQRHQYMLESGYHIHFVQNNDSLLTNLAIHGMTKKHIPETLGGRWTLHKQNAWVDARVRQDSQRNAEVPGKCRNNFTFPGPTSTTRAAFSLEEKAKLKKKRDWRDIKDNRRCRERSLALQLFHLKAQRDVLRRSNERLVKAKEETDRLLISTVNDTKME